MSELREALDTAGITPKDIHPGDVWLYNELLFLTDDKLKRKVSERKDRPVIVVENLHHCQDPAYITVLEVPASHRVDLKSDASLLLPVGCGGLDTESIAMVDILQPVLKRDLQNKIGQLPEEKFNELLTLIAIVVGITD